MVEAVFRSPIGKDISGRSVSIADETAISKAKVVGDGLRGVLPGHARQVGSALIYSTSPGEWTVLGEAAPDGMRAIDLTHVRVAMRITGEHARTLLAKVCALDFDDRMFPSGSAARTSVAGTTSEIVRDDQRGELSYLLVTSRSFGEYLKRVLVGQAAEFS